MTDVPVSLVGGAVRDGLLGVATGEDLDLVVEGDALALAARLGHELNARVVSHGRFGTAYVELPHERWIDLVTARRESYARPGALPDVLPGTLADDLARRDFTINAMAYRLTGPRAGEIVDPHGGRADLASGLVRLLRDDAFIEDPSRVVRAARYAARLGFAIEPVTRAAARAAAPGVDIASSRVGEELKRLLSEAAAAEALECLRDLGVPWVRGVAGWREPFVAVDRALVAPGAPAVDGWAVRLGLGVEPDAAARAAVDGWARGIAAEAAAGEDLRSRLDGASRLSEIDEILRRAKPATAVAAAAAGDERVVRWWREVRDVRLAISGEDLVVAGVAPGPAIGRALAAVRRGVLDGRIGRDRADQLDVALTIAEEGE